MQMLKLTVLRFLIQSQALKDFFVNRGFYNTTLIVGRGKQWHRDSSHSANDCHGLSSLICCDGNVRGEMSTPCSWTTSLGGCVVVCGWQLVWFLFFLWIQCFVFFRKGIYNKKIHIWLINQPINQSSSFTLCHLWTMAILPIFVNVIYKMPPPSKTIKNTSSERLPILQPVFLSPPIIVTFVNW